MDFRTEIESLRGSFDITHRDRIVLLGSCFADNVGERLVAQGFNAVHNPLGPLFNPASVLRVLTRGPRPYSETDFVRYADTRHCLDFANRYQHTDSSQLAAMVNADYLPLAESIEHATVIIVTFGTAHVWRLAGSGIVAGNCHKLPGNMFTDETLEINEITHAWASALNPGKKYIFTVSPVRYTSGGLIANSLSKAALRVAVDKICRQSGADYFPAFEIVNDDLRDYRFYAADMKHPSPVAVDYIYHHFSQAYFSPSTQEEAGRAYREFLRAQHRQILPNP